MKTELTQEEFDLYLKFKTFLLGCVKEIDKVNVSADKQLFILADSIAGILLAIEKSDPRTMLWILDKLNKGEQNDSVN